MLKFLFGLIAPSWQMRIAGGLAALVAAVGGLSNDLDEDTTNDTNWAVVGPLILTGIAAAMGRKNGVTSEDVAAAKR